MAMLMVMLMAAMVLVLKVVLIVRFESKTRYLSMLGH
jgi:hypothetical protein